MRRIAGALVLMLIVSCSSTNPAPSPSFPAAVGMTPYHPAIDPSRFTSTIDNPFLTLRPGAVFTYRAVVDGVRERNIVRVTRETKEILGVRCLVVRDAVYSDGELTEFTLDWYAQDADGNVWYFGEDTKEYENGKVVTTEGSWTAGIAGAEPGVVMPATPRVGLAYRQEFYPEHAEDQAEVFALGKTVTVPFGKFDGVLVTRDTTRLDPDVVEQKYYARGVGLVMERLVRGGSEIAKLVTYTE